VEGLTSVSFRTGGESSMVTIVLNQGDKDAPFRLLDQRLFNGSIPSTGQVYVAPSHSIITLRWTA